MIRVWKGVFFHGALADSSTYSNAICGDCSEQTRLVHLRVIAFVAFLARQYVRKPAIGLHVNQVLTHAVL